MTCFDQSNEQIRTDSEKKEGQNLIFIGFSRQEKFRKQIGVPLHS